MKKAWKALVAVLATVAMAIAGFAGASTAFAAETYTINPPTENNGHTYEVYQIFTGDLVTENDGTTVLSNVKWGKNGKNGDTAVTVGGAVPDDVLTALKNVSGTDQTKLDVIKQYADLTATNKFGTVSNGQSLDVPAGYYLIKDVDNSQDGKDDSYTLYIVKVVGDVTIDPKSEKPTSEKKVKDTNDSTGDTTEWQDSADYDIGDDVPFQLKGTVAADYDNYKVYKFTFHDVESAGLTFKSDTVKVYVDGNLLENPAAGDPYYTVATDNLADADTFEVQFPDLKKISSVKAGSVITVEYQSTLNENAVIGSQGNPNTMHLTYSNNPNDDQGGENGKTPDDTVIVFTYKTVVNKVDQNKKPLAGAEFTLEKKIKGENGAADTWTEVGTKTVTGDDSNVFTWKGLDDGDYRLTETVTPAGYNTIAPIEFTITATHDVLSDSPALKTLSGDVTSGTATFTADTTSGSLTTDVENKKGSTLPSTGGMGTTILYAAGIVLVLAAGLWFGLRRRNGARR